MQSTSLCAGAVRAPSIMEDAESSAHQTDAMLSWLTSPAQRWTLKTSKGPNVSLLICRMTSKHRARAHIVQLAESAAAPVCRTIQSIIRSKERTVIDNEYILGLLWQQRKDIAIALVCAVLCTISNLAAPVISGYFIEILAGRQPTSLYLKVRHARRTHTDSMLRSTQFACGMLRRHTIPGTQSLRAAPTTAPGLLSPMCAPGSSDASASSVDSAPPRCSCSASWRSCTQSSRCSGAST
jgi:hypothetical protein